MLTVEAAVYQQPPPNLRAPQSPSIRALVCTAGPAHTAGHPATAASTASTRKRSRSGRYTAALLGNHTHSAMDSGGSTQPADQSWHGADTQSHFGWDERRDGQQPAGLAQHGGCHLQNERGSSSEAAVEEERESEEAADDDSELQVLSVRHAVPLTGRSAAARRAAEERQWSERWRDKQWRVSQIADRRDRDIESDSPGTPPTSRHTRCIDDAHCSDWPCWATLSIVCLLLCVQRCLG